MICEKNKCTGCYACVNICPKNAIYMKEDELGNVYPEIEKEKCVDCNLCKNVCPSVNLVEFKNPIKCFAMIAKQEKIRNTSTSGGAATVFSKYIIEDKKGIVYGATFENGKVHHIRVSNTNDLYKLQGSKYVHSYIENIYKLAKEDLNNELHVLFIGTPCQIAGLKKYLNKEYEKLYLVDIICHGVPSQKLLSDEIKLYDIKNKITNISFRGTDGFKIKVWNNKKLEYANNMVDSLYYTGFMQSLFYRDNCYSCFYAKPERISDMTIGDFWGLSTESKLYSERESGVSVLLPCTEKGLELIDKCSKNMKLEERNVEEAINGNDQLRKPAKCHKNNKLFKKTYKIKGFKKAAQKALWFNILKREMKKNKLINFVYKKLKG